MLINKLLQTNYTLIKKKKGRKGWLPPTHLGVGWSPGSPQPSRRAHGLVSSIVFSGFVFPRQRFTPPSIACPPSSPGPLSGELL